MNQHGFAATVLLTVSSLLSGCGGSDLGAGYADVPHKTAAQVADGISGVSSAHLLASQAGLRLIKGFRDEVLRGDWKGHRSSRLNQQYRVIYRTERDQLLVEVVEVNPHDYQRKS